MKWKVNIDGVPLKSKYDLGTFGVGDFLVVEDVSCKVLTYTENPREVWLKRL